MKAIIFLKIYFGISLFILCCNFTAAQSRYCSKAYGSFQCGRFLNTVIPTKDIDI